MAASGISLDGKENFTRLYRLIVDEGTKALRVALDKEQPSDTLAEELNRAKPKLKKINDAQWKLLYPASGDPNYSNFDIILLFILIRNRIGNLCKFTRPPKGWDEQPDEGDKSKEANFVRIKLYRNQMCHKSEAEIDTSEFESLWDKISEPIIALGIDKKEIERLRTEPIDPSLVKKMEAWKKNVETVEKKIEQLQDEMKETKERLKAVEGVKEKVEYLEMNLTESLETEGNQVLESELPDPLNNIKGRTKEIDDITALLKEQEIAAVLVTGGPGFGKTAVANQVVHILKEDTIIKFCSLNEFTNSFTDLLREILFVCSGEMGNKIEGDLKTVDKSLRYILLGWCRRVDANLVLWLDDVEGALEGKLKDEFLRLLSDMRKCSKSRIKFLITSRTAEFASPAFPSVEESRIGPLKADDSIEVIRQSLEVCAGRKEELNVGKLKQVAKLCDHNPLALCISGALLSDYNLDELIDKLRNDPTNILQDVVSGQSIENAIDASFNVLEESLKLSLVSLSVFIGPFDKEAARALLGEKKCEQTLRVLRAKSLLEKASAGKYVMHSLIQSYVRSIGARGHLLHYRKSEQMYFDHFVSVLGGYSEMFRSKDGCKKSIEMFNSNRIHLEHAINNFSELSKSSPSLSSILKDFENISDYAKMCILPKHYESFLRLILQLAEKNSDTVLQVQVLCQLGNEMRKLNKTEYKEFMQRAETIQKENYKDFESRNGKKAYLHFLNSSIRYLQWFQSEQTDLNSSSKIKDACTSLEATYHVHCTDFGEKSLSLIHTLDEFGMRFTKEKRYDEAITRYMKSLEIKQQHLGNHVFTAYSLKDLADLELNREHNEKALDYYKPSKEMFEKLGMLKEKESVLLLKNMACCFRALEQFDEAERILREAKTIAEQKLEGDHFWKLLLTTEEAVLCCHMNKMNDGKKIAIDAVEMSKRLKRKKWPRGSEVYAIINDTWTKRKYSED